MIPFIGNVQNRQIYIQRKKTNGNIDLEGTGMGRRSDSCLVQGFLGDKEKVLKLIMGIDG